MTAVAPTSTSPALEEVTASYIAAASSSASAKGRRLAAQRFGRLFGDLDGWNHASVEQRRQVRTEVMSFAAHAAIASSLPVTPDFVSQSCCHWGIYIADAYPEQRDRFTTQALELGFTTAQSRRMWSHLARICVIAGTSPDALTTQTYQQARTSYFDAVMASRASAPPRWLSTPLFGLDAVMFHRGKHRNRLSAGHGRRAAPPRSTGNRSPPMFR